MDITTARAWVLDAVRDQSGVETTQVDRATMHACREFCRLTRAITRTDDITITSGSSAFPLTVPIANGFRRERILRVWIDGQARPISVIGYPDLNELIAEGVAEEGYPTHLAIVSDTATAGVLWPTPAAAYTGKLSFWQPFGTTKSSTFATSWVPGTTSDLDAVLNIPDDLIAPVLTFGAAALIRTPSPEVAFGTEAWARFLAYCVECEGSMNTGRKSIQRVSARDARPPRRVIREVF